MHGFLRDGGNSTYLIIREWGTQAFQWYVHISATVHDCLAAAICLYTVYLVRRCVFDYCTECVNFVVRSPADLHQPHALYFAIVTGTKATAWSLADLVSLLLYYRIPVMVLGLRLLLYNTRQPSSSFSSCAYDSTHSTHRRTHRSAVGAVTHEVCCCVADNKESESN